MSDGPAGNHGAELHGVPGRPDDARGELMLRTFAFPADANPADGSVGWVAVLSHGFFGISATDSELERIGIKEADGKTDVRGMLVN